MHYGNIELERTPITFESSIGGVRTSMNRLDLPASLQRLV
jgi:hypothetical protein